MANSSYANRCSVGRHHGLADATHCAGRKRAGNGDGDIGCARVVRSISSLLPSCVLLVLTLYRSSLVTYVVSDERNSARRCLENDRGSRCGGKTLLVVGVTIGSATPRGLARERQHGQQGPIQYSRRLRVDGDRTYHVKSDECIELNQAVEIAKDDGQGQEANVGGVAAEQAHELDDLGKGKHEDELGPECQQAAAKRPFSSGPPARGEQKRVDGKGKRGKGCKVQGISAPWLLAACLGNVVLAACTLLGSGSTVSVVLYLHPDVPLAREAGPVAAPVAARPPRALVEELGAVFQRRLELAFALVLNPRLPLMADEPPRHKVVVVGVENPLAPFLVFEPVEEVVALQNLRSIGACATRHAGCATVHVVRGRNLKVAPLNVSRAEPVPHPVSQRRIPFAPNALVRADTTHLGILKGGEEPGHERRGPGDVVVGHDGNGSLDLRQGLAHLQALVGNGSVEDADGGISKSSNQLVQGLSLVVRCHQNEFGWLASEDALKRRAKLLKHVMDGWNNNGDILVSKGRLGCNGL